MIGQTLSHFKITAKLGEGGMGEVYRAEDTKLGRDVAIKVLPEAFSEDPERFARFEREAQLLAHLNHPNIAAIYDLAEDKGTHFLVLEFVEGEDLATRLSRGPLGMQDVLTLALQIAGALEVAHDKGIVHRDLKPSNIMVTPEGQAKVLDFGLAKAFAVGHEDGASRELSQSPTMSAQATRAGVILGTAAYMSPEQARGMPVDKRSDIWSFGVVLSEMLSGRSLFGGETLSDTLAAVLRAPIDTIQLPDRAGRRVRYLLQRCLVRDPSIRLRDIGEARILLSTAGILADEAKPTPEPRSSRALTAALWAVALAAFIAAYAAWRAPAQETSPNLRMRFTIDAGYVAGSGVAVSPDGSHLAFRQAQGAFSGSLWVRPLDRFEFSGVPNTENANTYFWSANGREIAFIKGEELFAYDIAAGTTRQVLTGKEPFWGGSWSDQGVILLAMAGSIYRVPASGGTPEVVLAPEEGKTAWHARPSFLPGGERFLFTSEIEERGNTMTIVQVAELANPNHARMLIKRAMNARWSNGHLVYGTEDGVLTAQRASADSLELIGSPFELGRGMLSYSRLGGYIGADASASGVVAYRTSQYTETEFVWFSPTGQRLSKASKPGVWHNFDLSPDSQRIATTVRIAGSGNELWIIEPERGIASRVDEPDSLGVSDPTWSPDGQRLAFRLGRRLVTRAAQGGELRTVLNERAYPDSWSRDGKWLLYGNASLGRYDLFAIALDEDEAEPIRLNEGASSADEPKFSPDGRWVAYATQAEPEVYVIPFPPTGERWQLSSSGGLQPRWSADGNTLFYLEPGGRLMRVRIPKSNPRNAGAPEFVFDTGLEGSVSFDDYTVAADGRFLLRLPIQGAEANARAPIHVLVGWEEPER